MRKRKQRRKDTVCRKTDDVADAMLKKQTDQDQNGYRTKLRKIEASEIEKQMKLMAGML
jgi:hypothetical protein